MFYGKCEKWWKTLFFHMVDIALANGYILYQSYRQNNPDNDQLRRQVKFNPQNFREEVVRSLAGLDEYVSPDLDTRRKLVVQPSIYENAYFFRIKKKL